MAQQFRSPTSPASASKGKGGRGAFPSNSAQSRWSSAVAGCETAAVCEHVKSRLSVQLGCESATHFRTRFGDHLAGEGLSQADNFSRPLAGPDHTAAVGALMDWIEERLGAGCADYVGHRVVHGGTKCSDPQVIIRSRQASGLGTRWTRLQNARRLGSTRASCNDSTSRSAHQRRLQNALISLD